MVAQITDFLDDIRLVINNPEMLTVKQKSDLEDSVLLRIAGVACAIFSTLFIMGGLATLPWTFLSGAFMIFAGSAAGIVAHDFICWGNNWREVTLQEQIRLGEGVFENVINMVRKGNMLFHDVLSGYPFELHDTWVLKYIWKWQNPNVL